MVFKLFKRNKEDILLEKINNLESHISNELTSIKDTLSALDESLEEYRLEVANDIINQNEDIAKSLFDLKENINDNAVLLNKKVDNLPKDISTDDIVGKLGNMFNKRTDHILNENNKASNIIASGISSVIKAIGERATADVKMGVVPMPVAISNYNPSNSTIANNTVQTEVPVVANIEENSEEDAYNEIFAIQRKSRGRLPV